MREVAAADAAGAEVGAATAAGEEEDAAAVGPGPVPASMSAAIKAGLPQSRRGRVMDALAAVMGDGGSGEEEEEDDDEDEGGEGGVLDWRRKAV
jgi:hypothetical protein